MKTPPPPRIFDKRVAVVQLDRVPDGFGGFLTDNPVVVSQRWAYVRNLNDVSSADFRQNLGISEQTDALRFTMREFDFDPNTQFIQYGPYVYRVIVSRQNDQYTVSRDLIAVRIEPPTQA